MALELNGTTGVSLIQDGVVTTADLGNLASLKSSSGYTLTLPDAAGTILTNNSSIPASSLTGTIAGNGPLVYAYASTYAGITNTTWQKVNLDSEIYDTDSCFTGGTFTPNVAGYYAVTGSIKSNFYTTQFTSFQTAVYKNGTLFTKSYLNCGSVYNYPSVSCSTVVYCNGSTDYIELYVYTSGGSDVIYNGGSDLTYLTANLVRTA